MQQSIELSNLESKVVTFDTLQPGLYSIQLTSKAYFQPKTSIDVRVLHQQQLVEKHDALQLGGAFSMNQSANITIHSKECRVEIIFKFVHYTSKTAQFGLVLQRKEEEFFAWPRNTILPIVVQPVIHFFVLVHGNHGFKSDFYYFGEMLRHCFDPIKDHVFIMYSAANELFKTHDGIEECGRRLAEEVQTYYATYVQHMVEKWKQESNVQPKVLFSIVGHSLGGLFSRNALKYIAKQEWSKHATFLTYCSIHSPHLGSKRPVVEDWKWNLLHKTANLYLNNMIGQTGLQLNLVDTNTTNTEPLLLQMAYKDEYIAPLKQFKNRTLVSATHYDMIVPFCSASILPTNPYPLPAIGALAPTTKQVVPITCVVRGHAGFDKVYIENSSKFKALDSCWLSSATIEDDKYTVMHSNTTTELASDTENCVLFMHKMVHELHKLSWRRLHLEYTLESNTQLFNGTIHGICIKKEVPWFKPDVEAAVKSVAVQVQLLFLDHVNALMELVASTTSKQEQLITNESLEQVSVIAESNTTTITMVNDENEPTTSV